MAGSVERASRNCWPSRLYGGVGHNQKWLDRRVYYCFISHMIYILKYLYISKNSKSFVKIGFRSNLKWTHTPQMQRAPRGDNTGKNRRGEFPQRPEKNRKWLMRCPAFIYGRVLSQGQASRHSRLCCFSWLVTGVLCFTGWCGEEHSSG